MWKRQTKNNRLPNNRNRNRQVFLDDWPNWSYLCDEMKRNSIFWNVLNGRITDIVNTIQCNTQTRKAIGSVTLFSPLWLCEFDRVKEHLRISERKSCGINLDILCMLFIMYYSLSIWTQSASDLFLRYFFFLHY